MESVRDEWLRKTSEPPLEPELPICDAHHHLWEIRGGYLAQDLRADIASGHNVVSTVFVEGKSHYRDDGPRELRPVGETEFADGVAAQSLRDAQRGGAADSTRDGGHRAAKTTIGAAIVACADLGLGAAVERVLDAHAQASPLRLRGIRDSATWDADPRLRGSAPAPGRLNDARVRAGYACLARYALSFDAWVFHPQLPDVLALARAVPDTTIVLNHLGCPLGAGAYAGRRDRVFAEWKRAIAGLAACANVVVKLSALGMPRCGFGWHERERPPDSCELARAIAPYLLTCIDAFGPARCLFESNFPPDKVSFSYGVLWNAFKRLTQGFTPTERAQLFHDTAARVYRLGHASGAR